MTQEYYVTSNLMIATKIIVTSYKSIIRHSYNYSHNTGLLFQIQILYDEEMFWL